MADAARGIAGPGRVPQDGRRDRGVRDRLAALHAARGPSAHRACGSACGERKARLMLGPSRRRAYASLGTRRTAKCLIRPAKLAVWAGWTHHGKTQLVKQVMLGAVQQSERVLIASMEEEVVDVYCDMAVMACGVQQPSSTSSLAGSTHSCPGSSGYSISKARSSPRMLAVIRYAAEELKVTHVVVDSLMLLAVNRDDYEAQARSWAAQGDGQGFRRHRASRCAHAKA
jgi:hypothetical protein